MVSFEISWKNPAEKDLRQIDPKQIQRIINAIESLANNPFPEQHLKIKGTIRLYRLRVGDYRVIYHVNTVSRVITIYYIRHRKEVYRQL